MQPWYTWMIIGIRGGINRWALDTLQAACVQKISCLAREYEEHGEEGNPKRELESKGRKGL